MEIKWDFAFSDVGSGASGQGEGWWWGMRVWLMMC